MEIKVKEEDVIRNYPLFDGNFGGVELEKPSVVEIWIDEDGVTIENKGYMTHNQIKFIPEEVWKGSALQAFGDLDCLAEEEVESLKKDLSDLLEKEDVSSRDLDEIVSKYEDLAAENKELVVFKCLSNSTSIDDVNALLDDAAHKGNDKGERLSLFWDMLEDLCQKGGAKDEAGLVECVKMLDGDYYEKELEERAEEHSQVEEKKMESKFKRRWNRK